MSLINSLDTAVTAATTASTVKPITDQQDAIADNGLGKSTFGALLNSLSSGSEALDSSLTNLSNIEVLSVESLQDQLLQQTGLGKESLLSLAISDDLVSQMQQELLSSLQASMLNSTTLTSEVSSAVSSVSTAVQTGNPLQSTVGIIHDEIAATDEASSTLDDMYSFSFGEEGLDGNDLFDSINILNHIPILSDIYQISTDTDISPASKLLGGMLYSGYIGVGAAALELGMDYFTGYTSKDLVADTGLVSSETDDNIDTQ
ncbi:hypothetical protein EGC86_20125 [Shewanella frigidimarina]|uniref:hypothetical protein n=1 Tax=Shewanella frigidimarina TaxID=56812 RepID=UPI000F4DA32D|nr:hypothetical protein [Shewanella frigidimarina]RPA57756.1 hypothetical protein EGC86_20125 [Shewanella frigidimarina]